MLGRTRFTLLALTVVVVACAQSLASRDAAPMPEPAATPQHTSPQDTTPQNAVPSPLLEPDSEWYGMYIQDTKVGYMHRSRNRVDESGVVRIELRDEFHMRAVVLGGERSTSMVDVMRFDARPPHSLLSAKSETVQGEDKRTVRLVRDDDGYAAEVCEAGACRPQPFNLDGYTLAEALAPEVWVLSRPEEGAEMEAESLLLGELRTSRDHLTLRGYHTSVLDGLPVEYAEVAFEEAEAGLAGDLMITLDGRWLAGTLAGTFEVRVEPHETAVQLDDTTDLFLAQAVQVDRPLGDPRDLTSLTLALDVVSGLELPSTATQTWSCADDAGCRLTLGSGTGSAVESDDIGVEDIDTALESTVAFPADLPRVDELARRAVNGAGDDADRVHRLAEFVSGYIQDSYSAEPLSINDLLDDPRGDCTEHAALFITLARSLDIPAREVHGLLYIGDSANGTEGGSFGGHAWAEVLIDGAWLEVDPTWNEIPPSVGHIRLGHRLGDSAERQGALAGKTLRVLDLE